MSNENHSSIGSKIGSTLIFPTIFTIPEVVSVAKRNGGLSPSKMEKELELFKQYVSNAQNPSDVKDIFSRSISLSENYEAYKSAAKAASKAEKIDVTKIPFIDRILNPLRRFLKQEEVTQATIESRKEQAIKQFETIKNDIASGKNLVQENVINSKLEEIGREALKNAPANATKEELEAIAKQAKEAARPDVTSAVAKNFAKTNASAFTRIGDMFKKEITNPIVLFFAALEIVPEVKGKVIPAFKEKGFKAGIKQAGLSLFKAGANLLSCATGSTLGKVIGGAIGTVVASVVCPGAAFITAIGTTVGSILGISATNAVSGKIIKKVEDKAAQQEQKQSINMNA